jgi:hypothetical protein
MADWVPKEKFYETEYGRLSKEPAAIKNFFGPGKPYEVPPGGGIVTDPKDGVFGIVVDRDGKAVCKVVLKAERRSPE